MSLSINKKNNPISLASILIFALLSISTVVPSLEDMKYGNRFLLSIIEENKGSVYEYSYINPAYEEAWL